MLRATGYCCRCSTVVVIVTVVVVIVTVVVVIVTVFVVVLPVVVVVVREFTIYDATGSATRSKFQLKNER